MQQLLRKRLQYPKVRQSRIYVRNKPLNTLESAEKLCDAGTNLDTLPQQEHPEINASTTSTPSVVTKIKKRRQRKPMSLEDNLTLNTILSTPEFLPPSSKETWNVRYRHSLKNTVDSELFQTLAVASTLRGQDFRSLSSVVSTEMLEALWLPTATDFVGSPLTSSNSCSELLGSNSLFTAKIMEKSQNSPSSEKTSWPLFTFSPLDITANDVMEKIKIKSVKRVKTVVEAQATQMVHLEREDDQESSSELEATPVVVVPTTTKRKRVKKSATLKANNNIMRCVSVPVTLYRPGVDVGVSTSPYSIKSSRPLHQQPEIIEKRSLLNKLFGTYRHIYNATVQLFNDKKIDVSEEYDVRAKLTNLDGELAQPWYSELPTPSKQKAVNECFTQVKTNLAKGGNFKMKFKSKLRSPQQCLPYGNCKVLTDDRTIILPYELRGKTSPLNEIVLFMKNGVPDVLKGRNDKNFVREEVKVLMSRNGNLHVVIPLTLSQVQEAGSFSSGVKIVALDPGVRTFQTFYTPTGQFGKIGTCSGDDVNGSGGLEQMERLLKKIDKTISTLSKPDLLKSKKRRRLKRQKYRKLDQVKNVRNDFHRKTCVWLLRNFDIVLLPKFEVKDMVTSLNSKTCRAMYTWAHYAFKQRLLEMSQKYTHKKVLIVNEAYTTRTCGNCFVVNNNVGASKVFCCVHCDLEADRDVHAARNILLRYVPDLFVLPDALKC